MHDYTLEWLMAPFAVGDFRDEIWQKRPKRLASGRPGYFSDLFGAGQLELALEYGQPKPPSIRLASSRTDQPAEVPFGVGGRLDIDRIRRFFADGYTVILNNVQDYSPRVARLLQAMQERTSYPVEANCYLTPRGSQGFKPHYDTHDVIVAQVEGEKLWRVYGEDSACPWPQLTNGDPFRRDALPEPEQILLRSGDVLYIPRGWIHEAETNDSGSSLHLTFGIHAPTARDLLITAIDALCRVHPDFRAALPFGYLRAPQDAAALARILERVADLVATDGSALAAVQRLEDDFIRRGRTAGDGDFVTAVDAMDALTSDVPVERRRYLHARLLSTETGVGLQFAQALLQAPSAYRAAMEFVLESESAFRAAELPGLEPEQQLAFTRTLLRDGLVRLVDTKAQPVEQPSATRTPGTATAARLAIA